jgi:hypothetical protein
MAGARGYKCLMKHDKEREIAIWRMSILGTLVSARLEHGDRQDHAQRIQPDRALLLTASGCAQRISSLEHGRDAGRPHPRDFERAGVEPTPAPGRSSSARRSRRPGEPAVHGYHARARIRRIRATPSRPRATRRRPEDADPDQGAPPTLTTAPIGSASVWRARINYD